MNIFFYLVLIFLDRHLTQISFMVVGVVMEIMMRLKEANTQAVANISHNLDLVTSY
jgi:hypothetical protein